MANYQKMYLHLFNEISTAITILQKAQQATEELYLAAEQPPLTLCATPPTEE